MRRLSLVAAATLCWACAPKEAPPADSTAAAPAAAPAPVALTADQIAGAWNGISMGETSDSVTARWTSKRTGEGTSEITLEGTTTPIKFTTTFDADSLHSVSEPTPAPQMKDGPKIVVHSIGRLVDGKLKGTTWQTLADKPDSVISRGRWEATRAP
jgi:hypothetical protein